MAGGRLFAPSSWIGLKSTYVWKRWFIQWTENERLLLNGYSSLRFTKKFELAFVLTQENVQRFHFKTNKKSISSSKNGTRCFQNSPPFERLVCFDVTITGNFERIQYFKFEIKFLKNNNIFQKNGVPFFSQKC